MRAAVLFGLALVIGGTAARAQSLPRLATLVQQYESEGGRNIPNYKYQPGVFSAGGKFQITDSLFNEFKHKVQGADDYPNALAMPEQLQGQMFGWIVAERGLTPWTCCNPKLRLALESPQAGAAQNGEGKARKPITAPEAPPHNWDVFENETETSESVEAPSPADAPGVALPSPITDDAGRTISQSDVQK